MDAVYTFGIPILLMILIGAGFYAGSAVIDQGTVAVVFRFGKLVRFLESGLHWTIPFIERVERFSTAVIQNELPEEPQYVDRISDNPAAGKVKPFRVNHPGRREATFYVKKNYGPNENPFDNTLPLEELDRVPFKKLPEEIRQALLANSLHAPLAGEYSVVVEYSLLGEDPDKWKESIKKLIDNVSPAYGRDRQAEVRKRASDLADRILGELLSGTTFGHAQYMMPAFNRLIKERFEQLVGEKPRTQSGNVDRPWGIHVTEGYMKTPYPGHTVNEAQAQAAAAESRKEETIRDAEAQAETVIKAGEAEAAVIQKKADAFAYDDKKRGEGRRDRFKAESEALLSDEGKLAASLATTVEAFREGNTVFVPSDFGPFAALGKFFERSGNKPAP